MKTEDIKLTVKDKYGVIANQNKLQNQSLRHGEQVVAMIRIVSSSAMDYSKPDADSGLGYGLPVQYE